jgi:hypothetical protein
MHRPWIGNPVLRQEALPAIIHERQKNDRRVEDEPGEPRHAVDRIQWRRVEAGNLMHGTKPVRM